MEKDFLQRHLKHPLQTLSEFCYKRKHVEKPLSLGQGKETKWFLYDMWAITMKSFPLTNTFYNRLHPLHQRTPCWMFSVLTFFHHFTIKYFWALDVEMNEKTQLYHTDLDQTSDRYNMFHALNWRYTCTWFWNQ